MMFLRMLVVASRLVRPYYLQPWRSPLLRWRLETYGLLDDDGQLLHAQDVTAARFFRFCFQHARALGRFLHWAATL